MLFVIIPKNAVEIKSISAEDFIKLDHSKMHIIDLREKELVSLHPFTKALIDSSFSYIPSSGSVLRKAGFDSNEDMGAEDVPN